MKQNWGAQLQKRPVNKASVWKRNSSSVRLPRHSSEEGNGGSSTVFLTVSPPTDLNLIRLNCKFWKHLINTLSSVNLMMTSQNAVK